MISQIKFPSAVLVTCFNFGLFLPCADYKFVIDDTPRGRIIFIKNIFRKILKIRQLTLEIDLYIFMKTERTGKKGWRRRKSNKRKDTRNDKSKKDSQKVEKLRVEEHQQCKL